MRLENLKWLFFSKNIKIKYLTNTTITKVLILIIKIANFAKI
jgi:hypothetical protein